MMPTLSSVLRRWRGAVLWLLVLCSASAWAGDLVVERAWLEDPGGQLSWEEVQQRPMMPLQGVLSRGYGQAPLWMRLRIDSSAQDLGDDRRLYLRIRPMYLDEIVLFDPLQQPARQPPVGDRYPVSAQAEPATTFLLELPIGQGPRDVWLRVQTTSTRLIYADVFTPADLRRVDALINHLGALYLGLIVMFFLWGLLQLLMRPEPLIFSFLLYQGSWLLMGTSFLGYPYLYLSNRLPPGVVDQATNIAIVFSSASALLFSHFVLNELGSARWRRNVLTLIIIIIFSLLVAALGGYASTALKLNMLLVLLVPPTMWALAVMSKPAAHWYRSLQGQVLSKAVVVGYFSMLVVFTVLTALPALGLVQGAELSLYVVFFTSLASGVLMVAMLQYRAWKTLRQQSEWRALADEAKARADQEQAHREERERLLAMLGHELKTPLATMRMLLADRQMPDEIARRFDVSVAEMTNVVNLAVQSGQMEAAGISLDVQEGPLRPLIASVCRELAGGERVVVDMPPEQDLWIKTDMHLFKVVLRNLLDNALKYSPSDAAVHVSRGPADARGGWSLSVRNPVGRAGWPDPERLFEKYYRSPKASYRSGTGLGLYLVQGLVKLLGGRLHYAPVEGQVCFTLMMPHLAQGAAA